MSDGIVHGLNDVAGAWWSWMAPMTWQVALLVAVVWAVDRIARRWVWPQVLHALWLLVPLKLVLPPSLASPVSLVGRLFPARAVESVATIAPAPAPMPDFPAMMPPIDVPAMPIAAPEFTWHVALLVLWVAGMIALIGLLLVRLRAFSRILRSPATVPASAEIVEAAHRAAARLGLRRVPRIVRTPAVESPAAFGPFRPVILLPADEQYAPEELDGILLHELAHAKRADLLAHAMLTAFMFAYWFNPALWLAGRRIRALRELSCDATVAAVLRDETPVYRKTLLAAARRMLRRHEALSIGLLGITEDGSTMENRLRWLTGRPWKNRRAKAFVSVLAMFGAATCLIPMAAAETRTDRTTSTTPATTPASSVDTPIVANTVVPPAVSVRESATAASNPAGRSWDDDCATERRVWRELGMVVEEELRVRREIVRLQDELQRSIARSRSIPDGTEKGLLMRKVVDRENVGGWPQSVPDGLRLDSLRLVLRAVEARNKPTVDSLAAIRRTALERMHAARDSIARSAIAGVIRERADEPEIARQLAGDGLRVDVILGVSPAGVLDDVQIEAPSRLDAEMRRALTGLVVPPFGYRMGFGLGWTFTAVDVRR